MVLKLLKKAGFETYQLHRTGTSWAIVDLLPWETWFSESRKIQGCVEKHSVGEVL